VAYGVKDNGFSYFLLLYYNQALGLPAAWVGSAILTALRWVTNFRPTTLFLLYLVSVAVLGAYRISRESHRENLRPLG
jgi:hypothetical protein